MDKYIALDLENPNVRGNSVCAIGILVVENGVVKDKLYSLINPEDRFDSMNSQINGITAFQVAGSPTLKEYWDNIKQLLTDNIIVGHNITYDLGVLSKSLARYEIEVPKFRYICTLQLSQAFIQAKSHKLTELMKDIGYSYNAHNALEDAIAANELYRYLLVHFDLSKISCNEYAYNFTLKESVDEKLISHLNNLYGIIKGVEFDDIVNQEEIDKLKLWENENAVYKQYSIFNRIFSTMDYILEDGVITPYEKAVLMNLVDFTRKSKIYSETTLALQVMKGLVEGICADQKINEMEILSLNQWMKDNDYLSGVYPYDKVVTMVGNVLADGIITNDEKSYLLDEFNNLLNPSSLPNSENGDIQFQGKTFCLTGDFKNGSKAEISALLQAKGAVEKSGVSAKLNYLFVGGLGSEAWKYGNIGGKIAKAQELQEQGKMIVIISEDDLFQKYGLK